MPDIDYREAGRQTWQPGLRRYVVTRNTILGVYGTMTAALLWMGSWREQENQPEELLFTSGAWERITKQEPATAGA